MVKKMLKKMFSRQNVVLTIGVLLIVSGALVWVINFSFINIKNAKAAYDVTNHTGSCDAGEAGCFGETWTATEITGTIQGIDSGQTGKAVIATRDIKNNCDSVASETIFSVPGSPSDTSACGSSQGALIGDNSSTVVGWTVTGKMQP